ncbi:MAG: ATP-binding protein [Betaproteobacteria bacterium]|nr:ATP-binding protein [Betaproteobacteria bacterium]
MKILTRHLADDLKEYLHVARVIHLVGARQVGKTTLLREIFGKAKFISLDDKNDLSALQQDCYGHLASLAEQADGNLPIVIDEAQRHLEIVLAVKRIVDEHNRKGQFVLAGSSNLLTSLRVADSLAGRALTLKLWPLSVAEMRSRPLVRFLDWAAGSNPALATLARPEQLSRLDYIDLIVAGGYPAMRGLKVGQAQRMYSSYLDAVVERDVGEVLKIRKPDKMRRLINQLAARTACEINVAALGSRLSLTSRTVGDYIDILERLSIVARLGAYSSGRVRREIRNPKLHFVDTGMAAAIDNLQRSSFNITAQPQLLGGLFESFVHGELLRSLQHQQGSFRLYHWRGDNGHEVDIVAESPAGLVAIEVKASTAVTAEDAAGLIRFASKGPGRGLPVTCIVFYAGNSCLKFAPRVFALPASVLWGKPPAA